MITSRACFRYCSLWYYQKPIRYERRKNWMMMMMNCFCGMVDRRKAFSLISSRDHCQRSSPSWISNTLRAGFEPAQNLSSGFIEWTCAVVITTHHGANYSRRHLLKFFLITEKNWVSDIILLIVSIRLISIFFTFFIDTPPPSCVTFFLSPLFRRRAGQWECWLRFWNITSFRGSYCSRVILNSTKGTK